MSESNSGVDLVPSTRVDAANKAVFASIRGEIDLHNSTDLRGVLLELLAKHEPRAHGAESVAGARIWIQAPSRFWSKPYRRSARSAGAFF